MYSIYKSRFKEMKLPLMLYLKGKQVISPRRLGKSGLIQHVFNAMHEKEPDSICIYIDIMHTKNQTEFAELFSSRVIAAIDSNAQTALRKAAQFFKGIRPTMSFDEFNGSPSSSIDIQPSLDRQAINLSVDCLLQKWSISFSGLYQELTDNQARVLSAIACEGRVKSPKTIP